MNNAVSARPGASWIASRCPEAEQGLVVPIPDLTLPELIERQAAATPDRIAVVTDKAELSYRDFDTRANRLARLLLERGVRPGDRVAVVLRRTVDLPTCLFAILKCGAAYIPVDPDYPAERVAMVFDDAAPALVVVETETRDRVPLTDSSCVVLDGNDVAEALAGLAATPVTDAERGARLRLAMAAYLIYTSGTTGRPKGVVLTHTNIANFLIDMRVRFPLTEQDRWLAVASIAFDTAALELYLPLTTGATVVLADRVQVLDPGELTALLRRRQVTIMQATPSLWRVVVPELAAGEDVPRLRVLSGGEALPMRLATALSDVAVLTNLYGPTETTIYCTATATPMPRPSTEEGVAPIGLPMANTQLYALDGDLRPVGPNVTAELYVGGDCLARGYHAKPGLTATRFTADPFGPPGARMYRTGDMVHWSEDGELVFDGRADHQVKIRGYRIEPSDVEVGLLQHPDVAEAVVIARADDGADQRLVAYVTAPGADPEQLPAALRAFAAERLPEYMVPAAVVVLDTIPLTVHGKLDRRALPVPDYTAAMAEAAGPRRAYATTEQGRVLSGLFAEILGITEVGLHDNFFDLGGHSLLAIKLINSVRAAFSVALPVKALFQAPTVATLLEMINSHGTTRPPLVRRERTDLVEASLVQRRLWFVSQLEDGSGVYNVADALRLRGDVDQDALRAALLDTVLRQEILRTVYVDRDGVPYLRVLEPDEFELPLDVVAVPEAELAARMTEASGTTFDVSAELPFRAWLFEVGPQEHVLMFVMHHIAMDAWSLKPLLNDVSVAYRARLAGQAPGWEPLPAQYTDYAEWQREVLGSESDPDSLISAQLRYWKESLSGAPDDLALPYDRPRPAVSSYRGGEVPLVVEPELHKALLAVARRTGTSLFMVFQATLATALTRLGAGHDIPLASPVADRADQALDDLVGFFLNTLVLRIDTSGNPTFAELLKRVREVDLNGLSNRDVPFDRVVDELKAQRSLSRNALFQVMVMLQEVGDALDFPGVECTAEPVESSVVRYDLWLGLNEAKSPQGQCLGVEGALCYSTDLFDHATMENLVSVFVALLHEFAANPELPLESASGPKTRISMRRKAITVPADRVSMPDPARRPGCLGIDVGGTKVALRIEGEGAAPEVTFAWEPGAGVEQDLAALVGHVRALWDSWGGEIGAVGVAMPATLDAKGEVVAWPNRPSWVGANPAAALRAALPDAQVACADDGDLAALAEAGAAGCGNLVYVGIGTGVGGGIVLGGRPCPGPAAGSCELGHLIVDRSGPRCDCGRRGCVQAVASGPATLRRAAELRGSPVAPGDLPEAVKLKRPWAVQAVTEAAGGVAAAIAGVSELVRPELAVVGGGFAAAVPGYLAFVQTELDALARPGHPLPPVRAAKLGGLSSLRGAVELARQA